MKSKNRKSEDVDNIYENDADVFSDFIEQDDIVEQAERNEEFRPYLNGDDQSNLIRRK